MDCIFQLLLKSWEVLRETFRDFARSLEDGDTAVFFYAGHGLERDRRNFLVPCDANVKNESDIPRECLDIDEIRTYAMSCIKSPMDKVQWG